MGHGQIGLDGDVIAARLRLVGRTRHLVKDRFVGDFAQISSLDLSRDTDESLAESLLGRGVEHLLLDLGLIRRPGC